MHQDGGCHEWRLVPGPKKERSKRYATSPKSLENLRAEEAHKQCEQNLEKLDDLKYPPEFAHISRGAQ